MLGMASVCWVFGGLAAYTSGFVEPGPNGEGLTVEESFYLMAQIITSVGYGDLVPKSSFGMVFTAFYTLAAGLVISGMVSEAVDYFVVKENAMVQKLLDRLCDDNDPETESFYERNRAVINACTLFCGCVAGWMAFYMRYCEGLWVRQAVCEDQPLSTAFYFAIISVTTVGFGDVTPKTDGGEIFFTTAVVFGVGAYVNLVGALTARIQAAKYDLHIAELRQEDLVIADSSADGEVDLYEFTRFILVRAEIVAPEVFDRIAKNFRELDVDSSGMLTMHDIALICKERLNSEPGGRKERKNGLGTGSERPPTKRGGDQP